MENQRQKQSSARPLMTMKPLTIFITGGAGYVGSMLVDIFSKRADVARIIALDKDVAPDFIKNLPKLYYIVANTSDTTWQKEVAAENPDVVIHTAWQIREMYGKKALQWKWNIGGSDNVFDFAFNTPSVKKLIHFSTVASYGAFSTNTIDHCFTEAEDFRKTDYLYAEEKRICEEHLKQKYELVKKSAGNDGRSSLHVQVAIIRPASITGPKGRYMRESFGLQSALSGQLKGSFVKKIISMMLFFVPITQKWCRQFIHEDEIADVTTSLVFDQPKLKNDYEAFNICPPGPVVTGYDMAAIVNKKAIRIHPWLIRIVFFFAWNGTLGRVPTSRGGWKSYSYPIAVDGSKITHTYGYQYRWSSKDAFTKKEGRYAERV